MPDLTTIGAALSGIKTSMDIAKVIKNSSSSLDEAETKLKIAELISSLADVKIELADVQDVLRTKDEEIRFLKEKFKNQKEMIFKDRVYWINGDDVPYCPVCWDKNKSSIHLHRYWEKMSWYERCHACNSNFEIIRDN